MKETEKKTAETLEDLHHPAMTDLEYQLKYALERRPKFRGRVLSSDEMYSYMANLIRTSQNTLSASPRPRELPPMLRGGGIDEMGRHLLENPDDSEARQKLESLLGSPLESRFFMENQDISTGKFLRYLPAYWRSDDYFKVYYVFSGQCPVSFEQESLSLVPGQVLIIPPGILEACNCPFDDCAVLFYMIRRSTFSQVFLSHLTSENLMADFFRRALNDQSASSYLLFETGQDPMLEGLLYEIFSQYNRDDSYSSQLLNPLMSSFFLFLLQRYEHTARVSPHSGIRWKREFSEILRYIQTHYATVTLEELSKKFSYSRRQLIRIIESCTGQTFSRLLTKLRMERASRMLLTGVSSMEQISAEVGYANVSGFYRAFIRCYGCTPGAYRAALTTENP